jgi:site-specific DNA-adenine methylase
MRNLRGLDLYSDGSSDAQATQAIENLISKHALRYNSRLFSWEDQIRLAALVTRLAEVGAHILVSNADYPSVINLYKGFFYYQAPRGSEIAGKANARGMVMEALLSTYPLMGCRSVVVR